MFLSHVIGFNFVRTAVACAILGRISEFLSSSDTSEPRYLKLVRYSALLPRSLSLFLSQSLYLSLSLDAISSVCHQLGLLSTSIHLIYFAFLSRHTTRSSGSCFSLDGAYMSSADRRLVIFLPPMLTFYHVLPEHQT